MAQTQLNRVYVQTIDSTGTTDPTLSLGVKSLTTTVKIGGIGTGGNSINVSSTGINMSGPLNALGQTNLQNTSILNVGITGQTTLENTSINGTLNVAGLTTLINVSTTSLSVLNNVSVGGNVSVIGNLYVSSNMILPTLTVGSNAVLENASIMGTLKATKDLTTLKNVSINETLDVVGLTTLNEVRVNGGTNFYNSVGITDNTMTFSGTGRINVAGTGLTTLQNTSILQGLTVGGNTSLSKTEITGTTDINLTGSATTTIGNSGSMTIVGGNASLRNVSAQALTVGPLWAGATTLASSSVTGNETVGGTLGVTGATTLGVTGTGALTAASLSVTGNETVTGTLGVTGATTLSGGATVTGVLNMTHGGNITLTGPYSASSTTGKLIFKNDTFGPSVSIDSPTGPLSNEDPPLRLRVQASGANFESISVNANNGNVAIGRSANYVPTNTLDVSGTFTVTGATTLSGGATVTGSLGIGTASPAYALEVRNSKACIGVRKNTANATGDVAVLGFNNGAGTGINEGDNFPDTFSDYGTLFGARIKAVAVGTYGVQSDLYFQYKTNGQYANLTDGAYSTAMVIKAGGNIGVGTPTPGYTLDISGSILVSGDATIGGGTITLNNPITPNYLPSTITSTQIGFTVRETLTGGNLASGTEKRIMADKTLPAGKWLICYTVCLVSDANSIVTLSKVYGFDYTNDWYGINIDSSTRTIIKDDGLTFTGSFVLTSDGSETYNVAVAITYSTGTMSYRIIAASGINSKVTRTRIA